MGPLGALYVLVREHAAHGVQVPRNGHDVVVEKADHRILRDADSGIASPSHAPIGLQRHHPQTQRCRDGAGVVIRSVVDDDHLIPGTQMGSQSGGQPRQLGDATPSGDDHADGNHCRVRRRSRKGTFVRAGVLTIRRCVDCRELSHCE